MARIDLTLSRLSTAGDHCICKKMEAIYPTAHSQIMCRIVMAGLYMVTNERKWWCSVYRQKYDGGLISQCR